MFALQMDSSESCPDRQSLPFFLLSGNSEAYGSQGPGKHD